MISFLKKIFGQKEEVVNFSEIDKWLDSRNTELGDAKDILKDLEGAKFEISENLKILEKVDVRQAKVEERVKSIVQGNLPAYTNSLSIFLKSVIIPKEADPVKLDIFCSTFEREFDSLNKKTFRNFQIIRELVGKELEDVAKSVKNLELLVKELKKSTAKIKEIYKLKEKAEFIKNSLESKGKNEIKKEELQKKKEELLKFCEKTTKEVENLKNSKKAKELDALKSESENISNKIKSLENNLLNMFSPLQKALKKYNNIYPVKKVGGYIENPAESLLRDNSLEILKFLKDVKKMVEEEKLDLKDEKKKKIVESIERLDEVFMKDFISEHASLKWELASIQEKIKANDILKEISDLEKEIDISNFGIENTEREINKLKEFDISSEVKALENKMKEIFNIKVKVENVMG